MIALHTTRPIALDSLDHTHPYGTAQDNSTHPPFNFKLYELISAADLRVLDLGCAGGGFVKSVIDDGGFAVGVDGSDYSRRFKRAEWPNIPDNLFTADLCEPMHLTVDSTPFQANVVTAWEFFEHISNLRLNVVIQNITAHLEVRGLLMGSISTSPEPYHLTINHRDWWIERFAQFGLVHCPDVESHFGKDWLRGPNSPFVQQVPKSFFLVMRRFK